MVSASQFWDPGLIGQTKQHKKPWRDASLNTIINSQKRHLTDPQKTNNTSFKFQSKFYICRNLSLPFVWHRQRSEGRNNLSPANPGSCKLHRKRSVLWRPSIFQEAKSHANKREVLIKSFICWTEGSPAQENFNLVYHLLMLKKKPLVTCLFHK